MTDGVMIKTTESIQQSIDAMPRQRWHRNATVGDPLCERELEILPLIAEGLTNRQIAARLSLSENTVKTHVLRLLVKLDAASRLEAAMTGIRKGLVPCPCGASRPVAS